MDTKKKNIIVIIIAMLIIISIIAFIVLKIKGSKAIADAALMTSEDVYSEDVIPVSAEQTALKDSKISGTKI